MTWNIYQPLFRFQTFKNSWKGFKRGNQQKHELQQHGQKHGISSIKEVFYSLFGALYISFNLYHYRENQNKRYIQTSHGFGV
jgi:hypothetical protein